MAKQGTENTKAVKMTENPKVTLPRHVWHQIKQVADDRQVSTDDVIAALVEKHLYRK